MLARHELNGPAAVPWHGSRRAGMLRWPRPSDWDVPPVGSGSALQQRRIEMADKLGAGAPFPAMTLSRTSGGSFELPGDLSGRYGIVLFYRGHW